MSFPAPAESPGFAYSPSRISPSTHFRNTARSVSTCSRVVLAPIGTPTLGCVGTSTRVTSTCAASNAVTRSYRLLFRDRAISELFELRRRDRVPVVGGGADGLRRVRLRARSSRRRSPARGLGGRRAALDVANPARDRRPVWRHDLRRRWPDHLRIRTG